MNNRADAPVDEESRERLALLHILEDLKREHDAAEQARKQWLQTVDAVRDPMMVHDADGRILRANKAYAERAGVSVQDLVGRLYWECFPRAELCTTRVGAGDGLPAEIETRNGEILAIRSFPIRDADQVARSVLHLFEDVTLKRAAEMRTRRAQRAAEALSRVASSAALTEGEIEHLAREVTEHVAHVTGVERANVWLFEEAETRLRCIDLYEASAARHSSGAVLHEEQFRREFAVLKSSAYVNADDPLTDERTAGYVEGYLKPLGITSMLDAVIQTPDRHLGLLCLEHIGSRHHWEDDEIAFACQLADKLALAIVNRGERRAAEELQKRERRFRALIENGSDLILVLDRSGVIRYASPVVEALSGYTLAEIEGKPMTAFLHPEDADPVVEHLRGLVGTPGAMHSADVRLRTRDGRWVDLSGTSKNALDDPNVRGIIVNARDVRERKVAERAIERSSRLYATLSGVNGAIVHAKDREGLFRAICEVAVDRGQFLLAQVAVRDGAGDALAPLVQRGLSAERFAPVKEFRLPLSSSNPSALAYRENRVVHAAGIECLGGSTPLDLAARELGAHGCAAVPVRCRGEPTGVLKLYVREAEFFDARLVALLDEMAADIAFALDGFEREAARKRAEDELRDSEARFRGMFYQSTVGMTQTSLEGRLMGVNPAFCAMLGYPEAELIGRDFLELTHPEDRATNLTLREGMLSPDARAGVVLEKRYLRRDGGTLWANVAASLVRDANGAPRHFVTVVENVSERKRAEGELRGALTATIEAIAATVETRDPYTAGHQRRVADLAAAIAAEMGLPAQTVEGIHFGALIHDLGKVQVPAELLAKPTRLTPLEFELIKTHPQAGYEIVKNIKFPWPVAEMVHQHHERLDGSGYPQGLRGEEIALEARILAVADVVEAMASHRPYRPGLGVEAALKEIQAKRGIWFEPLAVDACVALLRDKRFEFR